MKVAFVVLNWNKSDMSIDCVENVRKVEGDEHGIIVVDNNSDPIERGKIVTYAAENGWRILNEDEVVRSNNLSNQSTEFRNILLLANKNYGYARGNNLGLKLARSLGYKWAVVMNNDVILEKPLLKILFDLVHKDDKIAVIGPKVIGPDGKRQGPYQKPGIYDYFLYPVLYPILYPYEKIRARMFIRKLQNSEITYPYWLTGCFMLMNLDVLNKVGWFDENTFLYAEEIILSEKLYKAGYKVAYTDKVHVKHLREASTSALGKKRKLIQLESDLYYFREYRGYGKIRLSLVRIGIIYREFFLWPILCKIKRWFKCVKELF